VDEKQTVALIAAEVAQHEGMLAQHRTVHGARPLRAEHRIVAAKTQKIAMQIERLAISPALRPIELAAYEGPRIAGIIEVQLGVHRNARELCEEFLASFAHRGRKLARVIGEIEERARRLEFLPLKEQRCLRREEQQRSERAEPARTRLVVNTPAGGAVGELVVVGDEGDEARWRQIECRSAARLMLPPVPLALVEKPVLGRRQQLLRGAAVAVEVGLVAAGGGDPSAVVEVVVPERVEAVPAGAARTGELRFLRLVLADDDRGAPAGAGTSRRRQLGDDVRRRAVGDGLRGIETQTVEVELFDPVAGVR